MIKIPTNLAASSSMLIVATLPVGFQDGFPPRHHGVARTHQHHLHQREQISREHARCGDRIPRQAEELRIKEWVGSSYQLLVTAPDQSIISLWKYVSTIHEQFPSNYPQLTSINTGFIPMLLLFAWDYQHERYKASLNQGGGARRIMWIWWLCSAELTGECQCNVMF